MRLNHITLRVSDVEESTRFYRRLGFSQLLVLPGYARFQCPAGDGILSLVEGPNRRHGDQGEDITLHFECDRLEEVVSSLEQQGIRFALQPSDQPYIWRQASVRDPDGHRLFLYGTGEQLSPPVRLAS